MIDARPPRLAVDGQPDLERVLGREAVEAQGREEADDAARDAPGDLDQILALREGGAGTAVQAAADALDAALVQEPPDARPREPRPFELAGAGDPLSIQQLEGTPGPCLWCHKTSALMNKCRGIVTP